MKNAIRRTLVNSTPLDLSVVLEYEGAASPITIDLGPLEKQECDVPENLLNAQKPTVTLTVKSKTSTRELGKLAFHAGNPEMMIAPQSLQPLTDASQIEVVMFCQNRTGIYVEVFRKETNGTETRVGGPLAPGTQGLCGGLSGELLLARSVFTGELLDMREKVYSEQPWIITLQYREKKAKTLPIPSPLPGENVRLVPEKRTQVDRESTDYIVISERANISQPQFNWRKDQPTRAVKLSGVTLIWEAGNSNNNLMDYQGIDVLDIQSLQMFADRVVVRSPLRFCGTTVSIFARELVFEGDGQVNTMPLDPPGPAIPRNKKGEAENGANGEPGGHMHLYVRNITLPNDGQTRFVTSGSRGQTAEAGGLLDYKPKGPGQPTAAEGKNRTNVIDAKMIKDVIESFESEEKTRKVTRSISDSDRVHLWRWPGEKRYPQDIPWNGQIGTLDSVVDSQYLIEAAMAGKPQPEVFKIIPEVGGNVSYLKLVACDDFGGFPNVYIIWMPSRGWKWIQPKPLSNQNELTGADYDAGSDPRGDGSFTRPGDGEDSYPGGKPGKGGMGGSLYTNLTVTFPPDNALLRATSLGGGAPSDATKAVKGGAAGTPSPAYAVEMVLVNYDGFIASKRQPKMVVSDVSAKPGKDADGLVAEPGKEGHISEIKVSNCAWLHPDALDAVLAYAKDAYRNGDRAQAASLLDPYYAELEFALDEAKVLAAQHPEWRDSVPAEFAAAVDLRAQELPCRFTVIIDLRKRLLDNLDFYGNPPGWLPRLDLKSSTQVFNSVRAVSSSLLYFALQMEKKYETLEEAYELAKQTSTALAVEIDAKKKLLKDACTQMGEATLELQKVSTAVAGKQSQIDWLQSWATDQAQDRVKEQRIFRGVMKLIGGLLKVVPVGQPYLGLAGDVTAGVGDFNWNKPNDIPKQLRNTLDGIGNKTTEFLVKNKDLILTDATQELRDKLQISQSQADDLTTKLDAAKASLNSEEQAVSDAAGKTETEWINNNSEKVGKLNAALERYQKDLDDYIKQGSFSKEDWLKQTESAASLANWLQRRKGTRIRGLIDNTSEQIAKLEEESEKAREQNKKELAAKLKETQERLKLAKAEVTGIDTEITKVTNEKRNVTNQQTQKREKWSNTIDRLQGIGSGISTIGDGIAGLMTPTTTDDPEVQSLAAEILKSEKRAEYHQLLEDFKALAVQQKGAMDKITQVQAIAISNATAISQSLTQLNGLSQQRQSLHPALDLRVKRYLKDMQVRARDDLRWSIYNFVMAYRYEFLEDVEDSFFNLDSMVAELQKVAATSAAKKGKQILDYEEFRGIQENAVKGGLFNMFTTQIQSMGRYQTPEATALSFYLTEPQLKTLSLAGKVTFNVSRGNEKWRLARITDITTPEIELELYDPNKPLNFVFVFKHSGESIIRSLDDKCVWFTVPPGEDPITWGFTYDYDPKTKKTNITRNPQSSARIDWLKEIIDGLTEKKDAVELKEYRPSMFSDITLTLGMGTWKNKMAGVRSAGSRREVTLVQGAVAQLNLKPRDTLVVDLAENLASSNNRPTISELDKERDVVTFEEDLPELPSTEMVAQRVAAETIADKIKEISMVKFTVNREAIPRD